MMNPSEIKQVLQRVRSNAIGAEDEQVQRAFQELETNPELKAWFEQEEKFNQAMGNELQSITPPPNLRKNILRAMEDAKPASSEIPQSKPAPFLNWMLPLAAAAALIFAFVIFIPQGESPEVSALEAFPDSLAFIKKTIIENYDFQLEKRSQSLPELQAYLASYGTPNYSEESTKLLSMNPLGCLRLEYKGVDLGLICFEDQTFVYHVLSASRNELQNLFPDLTSENLPAIFESGQTSFKVWTDSQNVNILTHNGSNQEITEFF